MSMGDDLGFLKNAYSVNNTQETREFYGKWAETYDQEIRENGYVTPQRCAAALAQFAPNLDAPVLDVGCGTGLSGVALRAAGFTTIDGNDLSAEMLAHARAREGLYRTLWEVDLENPLPFEPDTYAHVCAMGVLATSHAPASTIDDILAILPTDGLFVFSLNDHTLLDPDYEARIMENVDTGTVRLLFNDYGDHLPGIDLKSKVYVLQKAQMRQRFAPSPTGYLHLGHAYSALTAWNETQLNQGSFLLRIEDIDTPRCRQHFETAIYEDLAWLGLHWPQPVMRQSKRMAAYRVALNQLISLGLCYPCACTRRDIKSALSAPQEHAGGPDGPVYPGTCRAQEFDAQNETHAIRLNIAHAIRHLGEQTLPTLGHYETNSGMAQRVPLNGDQLRETCGDIVLARRDIGTSYHLAVVVDDAAQGITHVTRGQDMQSATPIHVLLQALLGLATPHYFHHLLIRDDTGKRLAKRDDARAIRTFRANGASLENIREMVGL